MPLYMGENMTNIKLQNKKKVGILKKRRPKLTKKAKILFTSLAVIAGIGTYVVIRENKEYRVTDFTTTIGDINSSDFNKFDLKFNEIVETNNLSELVTDAQNVEKAINTLQSIEKLNLDAKYPIDSQIIADKKVEEFNLDEINKLVDVVSSEDNSMDKVSAEVELAKIQPELEQSIHKHGADTIEDYSILVAKTGVAVDHDVASSDYDSITILSRNNDCIPSSFCNQSQYADINGEVIKVNDSTEGVFESVYNLQNSNNDGIVQDELLQDYLGDLNEYSNSFAK